jgi:small subunit ribosomal protein S5
VGSSNHHNVVRAVFDALLKLRDIDTIAKVRGTTVEDLRERYNIYAR